MGLPLAVSDLEQVLNSWFGAGRRAGWRMLRRFCWSLSVLLELTGEREKGRFQHRLGKVRRVRRMFSSSLVMGL